jgi:hypothetical protein
MGTRQHAAGRHAKAKFASMLQRLMVVVERQLRQLEAVDDAGLGGKSAIDQASLIVRTAEKIDSLQRMLLAEVAGRGGRRGPCEKDRDADRRADRTAHARPP